MTVISNSACAQRWGSDIHTSHVCIEGKDKSACTVSKIIRKVIGCYSQEAIPKGGIKFQKSKPKPRLQNLVQIPCVAMDTMVTDVPANP